MSMPDGFVERGGQVTRLEAFVDAAFAFALTLVVIMIDEIPDSLSELSASLKGVPAFAACFVQLASFWHAHARWSRRYGMDDQRSVVLSLTLVFLVLVYVYPLKLLYGIAFDWLSGGWLPGPARLTSYREVTVVFRVYGIAWATLSLCLAALYAHALHRRRELRLSSGETVATLGAVAGWSWVALTGVLSIALTLVLPEEPSFWVSGLPGLIYFLAFLGYPVARLGRAHARKWLDAAP